MTHLRLALTIACLLAISTGCRMCASKYDYCGPTATGGCGQECGLCTSRSGSILSGTGQVAFPEDAVIPSEPTASAETAPSVQLGQEDFQAPVMPRQIVDGVEIEGVIISVEDGKGQEAPTQEGKAADTAEPDPLHVSDAKPTPAPSGESQGWSAKR